MSTVLSPVAVQDFFIGGIPASGGRVFVYAAGTVTKITTYTDSTGVTPQTNPIVLNARGEPENSMGASVGIWVPANTPYKLVFTSATDTDPPTTPIWTVDNLLSASPSAAIITVQTIAALKAYPTSGLTIGQTFYVDSYNAVGVNPAIPDAGLTDGGGGTFVMTTVAPTGGANTSHGVNNFTIFASNTAGYYFYRQLNGPYLIEWSGAPGDLSVDAGPFINNAINCTPDGSELCTYRWAAYLITTPILMKNRSRLTFAKYGVAGEGLFPGQLFYDGAGSGEVIQQYSCGECTIKGWIVIMNGALVGIDSDTAASGGTRISTNNRFEDITIYNSLGGQPAAPANSIGFACARTSGSNNEFFEYKNCKYTDFDNYLTSTATGFYQGNNGGFNTHYHVYEDCVVTGCANGFVWLTGGCRLQGFTDITTVQQCFNVTATYPCLIEFTDSENCQSFAIGNGQGHTFMRGCRVANVGYSGFGMFDLTGGNHVPVNVIEGCDLDVGSGSLIKGTSGSAGQMRFAYNDYGGSPYAITGINLNDSSVQLVAEYDALFGTNNQVQYMRSGGSVYGLNHGGLLSSAVNNTSVISITAGIAVFFGVGSVVTVHSTDGSSFATLNFRSDIVGTQAPQTNPIFFCSAVGTVVFTNTGGINCTKTFINGDTFMMWYNSVLTQWQVMAGA